MSCYFVTIFSRYVIRQLIHKELKSKFVGRNMAEKTMASIMQEEKEKLLAEIKKNINRKKMLMTQDDSETGFENFKRK